MTPQDRQLLDRAESDLHQRGSALVGTKDLDCDPTEFRSEVRKLGRRNGWKMRTMLVDDGRLIAALWMDREDAPFENEATRRALDDVLDGMFVQDGGRQDRFDEVRRANLRLVLGERGDSPT